jgi:hypothetical protein
MDSGNDSGNDNSSDADLSCITEESVSVADTANTAAKKARSAPPSSPPPKLNPTKLQKLLVIYRRLYREGYNICPLNRKGPCFPRGMIQMARSSSKVTYASLATPTFRYTSSPDGKRPPTVKYFPEDIEKDCILPCTDDVKFLFLDDVVELMMILEADILRQWQIPFPKYLRQYLAAFVPFV